MKTKNRGAISNPAGRFAFVTHEHVDADWNFYEEEDLPPLETTLLPERAKTIISHNDSPDIGFEQSINPYRGCEHGCIYCYARPSHAYVDLSPGIDFETKIFYKQNAAKLLEKEITKKNYICKPIMLGANTDPYQPAEAQLRVTRQLLEVCNQYNHPVAVITKGSLILRDLDLLANMAQRRLVKVAVSVTTLSNELKRTLEPRTATPQARLTVIRKLSAAGIPVRVMVAPIIPMINDSELEKILKNAQMAGASHASYVLIRLPHEVKDLFKEWLQTHYLDRAEHVMSLIKQSRNGKEYDATFGKRMTGEGEFAKLIAARFKLACIKYKLNNAPSISFDVESFNPKANSPQIDLFSK